MAASKVKVRVLEPEPPSPVTVGVLATPPIVKSPAIAESIVKVSLIVSAIVVGDVVAADETGTNKFQAVAANTFIGGLTGAASFIPGVDGDKAADRVRRALVGDKFADVYKESKDAYGPTEFNLAYDEIKAGRPLNLGQGYFPSSTPIEETQG